MEAEFSRQRLLQGVGRAIELGLELDWRNVAQAAVQAGRVEPMDPVQRRELQVVDAAPRPFRADEFGLVQTDQALGQRVETPIDVKCSGGLLGSGLGVLVGVGDGREQVVDLAGEVALEAADDLALSPDPPFDLR